MPSDDSPTKEESSSPSQDGGDRGDSSGDETSDKERVGPLLAVGIFTALGFELAAFVFVGLYLGHWVDEQAGTSPAFMLVCVIAACVAAGWHVYRIAERYL